jgi:hypothetical protein
VKPCGLRGFAEFGSGLRGRVGAWRERERGSMAPVPDLVLKDNCTGCRATNDLYGSNCGHLTLCVKCGKAMAETAAPCSECGTPVTRLIKVSEGSPRLSKMHLVLKSILLRLRSWGFGIRF